MKRTILYFDAEAAGLKLFGRVFGGEYDVHLTSTLSEAGRVLSEHCPDIVISEQVMLEIRRTDFCAS